MPARALRLRGVLDDRDAVRGGQRQQSLDRGALPVQVHRHDRPGARGERPAHGGRVDQQVVVVDVDRNRHRADPRDGLRRRHEGGGGQHHLVAAADARGAQRQLEGVGAVGDADAVPDAEVVGVVALEGRHLRAADEATGAEDLLEPGAHLGRDLGVLRDQVDERNPHRPITAAGRRRAGGRASGPRRDTDPPLTGRYVGHRHRTHPEGAPDAEA